MNVRELRQLRDAVDEALATRSAAKTSVKGKAAPASGGGGERRSDEGTLRREKVSCGKKACKKCADGPSHGPYWYLYYYRNGKLASKYLGKNLPNGFEHRVQPEAEGAPRSKEEDVTEGREHGRPQNVPGDLYLADLRQDEPSLF